MAKDMKEKRVFVTPTNMDGRGFEAVVVSVSRDHANITVREDWGAVTTHPRCAIKDIEVVKSDLPLEEQVEAARGAVRDVNLSMKSRVAALQFIHNMLDTDIVVDPMNEEDVAMFCEEL